MAFDFGSVFEGLISFGFFDVIIPLLLIFTLVFAILRKTNITNNRNIDIIISLVLGLLTVVPHVTNSYPKCWDIVDIMNNALATIAITAIVIILIIIAASMLRNKNEFPPWLHQASIIGSIILVIIIFLTSSGTGCNSSLISMIPFWVIIPILLFIFAIWFISRKPENVPERPNRPRPGNNDEMISR